MARRIKLIKGYIRKDGTVVKPHLRTKPDKRIWNNLTPRPKRR